MSIKKSLCSKLIKNFQLQELFNQLGWNHTTRKEQIAVDNQTYQLQAIAEKNAFFVFVCETAGKVPDYAVRKKIDNAITKLCQLHLIIFTDSSKRQQVWQLVVKELDKPSVVRETKYFSTQEPELLFQKLQHLFFSIDEEDNITIADVTGRVGSGFNSNAEKVTKKFYEGFKEEHTAFLGFINGISESQDKDWYASLMLNRLMFIYFIQKKGFLNNDRNYLRSKLSETQVHKGKDKFYSFYRNFLLLLFHEGLGSPNNKRFEKELGKVPYLNGGLFDVHELETTYTAIKIEDKAFERIFDFFDQYEWHLDTRQQATGKEINPDVIGYIFEKYINDRAAMGAYYTKEDITDYIGKNCIIPFLFDELKRAYPAALKKEGEVWKLMQQHPTDYIYPAIQHGVDLQLPAEIAKGLDNVSKRGEWNKPASSDYALPTEIWREVVERRRRYAEVKGKIEAGEIHEINDLITYNLNITRFAIDVIQNSSDPELIRHFYKALEKITVLDPTCGSGAFLFAAMNILEPLYEACIGRMRAFIDEDGNEKFKTFYEVLKRVDAPEHPNLQYFIFKTIILNNLYGVDIMHEAIEIAKLRLFLKLVACVDVELKKPNFGLEPLPDIDFNIRSGNTLVGFVSIDEVKRAAEGSFDSIYLDKEIASVEEAADLVKRAYDSFREVQMAADATVKPFKKELSERLAKLNDRLDVYLGRLYGKDPKKADEYKIWHDSHRPFHWFSEFFDIIHDRGGFDVIIGNPPYVEYQDVRSIYTIKNYGTESCGNLYAYVMERIAAISKPSGKSGMIVPMSGHSTDRMMPLVEHYYDKFATRYMINISADANPCILFPGVKFRLAIFLTSNSSSKSLFTTRYLKWFAEDRGNLFTNIEFANTELRPYGRIPKIKSKTHDTVFKKISSIKKVLYSRKSGKVTYYHNTPVSWIRAHNFIPYFISERDGEKVSTQLKALYFNTDDQALAASGALCSTLFYIWWITTSDCYHLNKKEVESFPIDLDNHLLVNELAAISKELIDDFKLNSKRRIYVYKTSGRVEYDEFYPKLSKPIIDKIDSVLAKHYGFTAEELDFIINYDIKYRMGRGGSDDEDAD